MPRDRRLILPILGIVGLVIIAIALAAGGGGDDKSTEARPTPTRIPLTPQADPPAAAVPLAPGDYGYPFQGANAATKVMHTTSVSCLSENLMVVETEDASYYIRIAPENNLECGVALPNLLQAVTVDNNKDVAINKKRFGIRIFEEPSDNPNTRYGINLIWDPGPLVFYRTPAVVVVPKTSSTTPAR